LTETFSQIGPSVFFNDRISFYYLDMAEADCSELSLFRRVW